MIFLMVRISGSYKDVQITFQANSVNVIYEIINFDPPEY